MVGRVTDGLRVVERLRSPAAGIVVRVATAGVTEPGADCFWVAEVGSPKTERKNAKAQGRKGAKKTRGPNAAM
jgi:hypothetical protein